MKLICDRPAKIIQPPVDTRAIAGESVLFFCQAEGNPAPRIVFRWNDVELTHSRPGMQLKVTSPDSVSLRAKLENSHNGDSVTCYAQNQVGSDSATAHITVYNANETEKRKTHELIEDSVDPCLLSEVSKTHKSIILCAAVSHVWIIRPDEGDQIRERIKRNFP
ncbi:unnamed protein product [Echinostoma caproni]|uniref:Ig-like domain-containing protein n=1 Tax=Echinostoma caproni TaxID=27848 RepID=A0A183A7W2_9TREM|nr:unnamed protein product [Echinostoma caproni]